MHGPDRNFWQQRFEQRQTPWDRAGPGPQLQVWIEEGMFAAGERVVVPGCGSGHDVLALAQAGAVVTGLDYAPAAVEMTRDRLRQAGVPARIEQADVLDWVPDSGFDAVYEQTCWCALHPDHWDDYAAQLARWLRPQGRLFLMAMQCVRPGASQGRIEGPPYHMDVHGLRALLPSIRWDWPAPPYPVVPHPVGWSEIAVVLRRR